MNEKKPDYVLSEPEVFVLHVMQRLNRFLHIIVGLALLVSAIIVIGLFVHDVWAIITGTVAGGFLNALGTLLILWTLSELINAEVRYLQGEHIRVAVFIEVAIAATIRKLLVVSAEGVDVAHSATYILTLLALGIVYWLLNWALVKKRD